MKRVKQKETEYYIKQTENALTNKENGNVYSPIG